MCDLCNDTGWILGTQEKDGKMIEVASPCLTCRARAAIEKLTRNEKFKITDWSQLDYSKNDIRKQIEIAKSFFGGPFNRLILTGQVGVGKTTVLKLLLLDRARAGKRVFFTTAKDFKGYCMNPVEGWEEMQEYLAQLKKCDELFIDGIGEEPPTKSELFESEMERIFELFPGKIVCTANKSPDSQVGERYRLPYRATLLSRMCEDSIVVAFPGKDFRVMR